MRIALGLKSDEDAVVDDTGALCRQPGGPVVDQS